MKLQRLALIVAGCLATAAIVPAARYVYAGSPVAGTGSCMGLVLHLQPGQVGANGRLQRRAPADIPKAPILLAVPLPAGATASHARLAMNPDEDIPITGYIKTAVREFRVPLGESGLMAWYTRSFDSCGYLNDGYGTAGGPNGSIDFRDFRDPALPQATVAVSFQAVTRGTLVLYYGGAATVPNRSPRTLIRHIRSVRITYHPSLRVTRRVVIPGGAQAQVLAEAINSLPRDVFVHGCDADYGLGASMIFTSPGGRVQRANLVTACGGVTMGGQGFDDVNSTVSNALGFVVYKWLFSHPHKG